MSTSARCHGCAAAAVVRLRVVPHSATRTLFDTHPRDIDACAAHIKAAKGIGQVLAVTPLDDTVVTRVVEP